MLGIHAQRTYTFNAVALNVDGLPEKISGVTVNEGAPGAEGATTMGNAIAKQNWDIVGLSEDFDYHESLVAPLTNYYHIGTWRGAIALNVLDIIAQNSANTDGLGLLVAKRDGTGYTNETIIPWSTYNGYTDKGADGLIKKGFRFYAATIASGIVIDVYILHMDADSNQGDIDARNAQLAQLATYIKNNKTGRPTLIIGDTNCRYTRDAVKTNLIDAINADSRLTIKDVWVEKMWGGEYPALGADAMMWYNAPYDNNTGEVVDKIFYINDSQSSLTIEANSYLHNTSFGVSDHYPVIANFTITDNSASTPTDAEKEESWTLEETAATDSYKEYKDIVAAKVNETYQKVLQLNDAGQAAYDISTVTYRYNNNLITSQTDADALCAMVDEAYANAWEAHKNHIASQAIANMDANEGDITSAIINPSFETGDLTGWTVTSAWDLGAKSTSDAVYAISGSDGSYLFNAWSGDESHTSYVKQTIKGIPNGLYELKAVLASFGTADGKSHDYQAYLTGNDYHSSVAAVGGKTVGQEATLYFLVENHTATIGAVGGNKGGGSTFIHYWPWEGCFFKADNFRLKRICDVPHGRLKLALMDAENAALDAYGKAALNISNYQTIYDNKSLSGDGTAEVEAIHTALQTAAKAQTTAGADMTWAITNPSFETGDYTGWSTTAGWDTGAKPQENGTYTIAGTDGRYMFNTWNNAADATNSGVNAAITQTVTGIPNGTYKLTAMVATDAGNSIKLTGNDASTSIAASTNGASSGVFPEVECMVSDGTLTINVEGVNSVWYKCDDFHLTLISPAELVMNETDKVVPTIVGVTYPKVTVNRTIKPNTWSTFVVPFDIPAGSLTGWEVKELTGSTLNGEHITLTFSDAADGIKAGVPYMVRNTAMTENLTAITMENAIVNTTLIPTETDHVTFTGVYTNGYVPEGTFFISGNKFYRAADASNTMKGFRGYTKVKDSVGATAYSLSYRTDGATDITDATTDDTATIVAIYNANGMRLDDMQPGINILRMSNGETIKVIIK